MIKVAIETIWTLGKVLYKADMEIDISCSTVEKKSEL